MTNKKINELMQRIAVELNKNSYSDPVEEGMQSPEETIGAIKSIVAVALIMNE